MSDQNPLVTIYIPTYNRVDLLKRAVESVRNQTYTNLEIIIVDDCSTDTTHKYLKEISDLDQRIRYFIKEKNSGACVSRNIAIKNASGEYITGLDDDDYFLENRIEIFIKNREKLENYLFLYGSVIYEKNKIKRKQGKIRLGEVNFNDMKYMNHVGNQIFCKKAILEKHGFNTNLRVWQDWNCWASILKDGGTGCLIDCYTYVLDDSDHARITNDNRSDKIKKAFEEFSNDLDLDFFDKEILSVNMIPYGVKINFLRVFRIRKNDFKILVKLWYWKRIFNCFKFIINIG